MSVQSARLQAERLIESFGVTSAPIDVQSMADNLGLPVVFDNLGSDVSGLLVSNTDGACIFIQETDPTNRQRFTIAHEIAHHVLGHQFEDGQHVHVDRGNFISQRGERASAGIDPKEIEANQFAAALLMPAPLLKREAATLVKRGPLLDHHVIDLAERFEVSEQAMTIRLTTLGLL
jgi:Zn-dependent peptidase ImmA (M78 family)